jgi:hypothetical protein
MCTPTVDHKSAALAILAANALNLRGVPILGGFWDGFYSADWSRQGQAWDEFVEEMWAELRGST